MPRGKRLATLLSFIVLAVSAHADNFIRVSEDDSAARLQTAVTRFEKDGRKVDLIGAVHIADKAYYQALDARFKTYDALLFEMIGGENLEAAAAKVEDPATKKLSGLRQIYSMVARFLKLTGQTENIDYTAGNFIHADLTLEEFQALQAERGESILGFVMAAAKQQDPAKPNPLDPAKLAQALFSGSSDRVKLELVHTLGQAEDQIGALAGESVIISDRNARCIEVMNRELAAGRRNLGIFYGAAHFPDMEKRMLELGFKRSGQEWLTAWNIPKVAKVPAVE